MAPPAWKKPSQKGPSNKFILKNKLANGETPPSNNKNFVIKKQSPAG